MKLKILALLCAVVLPALMICAFAQNVQVTGKVTSKTTNEPLIAATIAVKGSPIKTATDAQGEYKITVPAGAVLVFTYVGMQTVEIKVDNGGILNMIMTDMAGTMEEVVVIGYGTQKKSVVTGAISSVKAADLENMPIYRIEQVLQGRGSGLTIASASGQPGSGATVRVRGTTSINGAASNPLYVIDGMIVDNGGIDNLNHNDIESVEILKDAASAAIYGTRGAAGVILITTKKGRAGRMSVSYNGYYGVQEPARKLELLDATQYALLRNEASVASGGAVLFSNPAALGKGTDWQELIFNRAAPVQDHQLSIAAGNDRSTYYVSFGYFNQHGVISTDISKYERFTVRFNSSHKLNKWLSFGNNIGYSHIRAMGIGNTNNEFGGPLSSSINLDPITPAIVTDPAMLASAPYNVPGRSYVRDEFGNMYGISTIVQQEMTNPLAYARTRIGNHNWSDNTIGNVYFEAEPVKGLKLRSTVGAKIAFWGDESFTPLAYFNSTNSNSNTVFYRANNRGFNWNLENTASYTRTFGDHNATILVGTGHYVDDNTKGTNATYRNVPANTYDEASMNYNLPAVDRIAGGYEAITHKIQSIFGRVTYNYKERYLFTGILRRDGSTRFGSNNKYGYFPSAAIGWVASKEQFWPYNNVVTYLKVRGSFGVNGTDELGNFAYVSTVGGGRNYTFGNDVYVVGNSPNAPANPDLKWEETTQQNIGFEATLFKQFTLVFDLYSKKTTGMLQPIILPGYVGVSGSPTGNVASMENRGFEVELGYKRKLGQVDFDFKANLSHLRNEVTDLGTVEFRTGATFHASDFELTRNQVGNPIGSFYGFQTMGIFQTQEQINAYTGKLGLIQPNARPGDFIWADLNGDGTINADDRTFIGDPTPTWSYGFTAQAEWKGFDMVVFCQGVSGNDIFNGLRRLDIVSANWTTAALDRWTGPGTSNTFPRLVSGDPNKNFTRPSSFYLSDGSYFRIKTIQIGYTISNRITSKVGIQRARVYVSGNNLVTFTKYSGFDPEIGGGSYGIDRGVYPQARAVMFGINLGL